MRLSKSQKSWFSAYYSGFATQAEVMRKCKLAHRNDFYRVFHHYIMSLKQKTE